MADAAQLIINRLHVREQFLRRYPRYSERVDEIIDRVVDALENFTPLDWRFTESPSSRFFVVEEETEAKFLGISYRDSAKGREIVAHVKNNIENAPAILKQLDAHVETYVKDVMNPRLPVVHQIRTVYGKGKGAHIVEEKHLFEQARSVVPHLVPLTSRKIASRPNAVVSREGTLWVRQYMNWMGVEPNSKEYYLFQPLQKAGVDKTRAAVFSYTENGRLQKVLEKNFDCGAHPGDLSDLKGRLHQEGNIRSESYWKVPTYLDCRLMDLDFLERYSEKGTEFSSHGVLELYFLKKIVYRAREKLYGPKHRLGS